MAPQVLFALVLSLVGGLSASFVEEPSTDAAFRLSNPLIGNDGKVYACCGKSLFAFKSNGTVAWTIPLEYSCRSDVAPVGDERGKIYLIAEDRVLKIRPSNIGTSESAVEIFFGQNSTTGISGEIIGFCISIWSSSIFVNVKNRALFAFMLRGQLLWSAGPMLERFGYPQGCKENVTDCYFSSAPVFDQCDGSLYISNTEGQLYSLYTRSPQFKWIQDFSSFDNLFLITPGNNGLLYVTFPRRALLMGLDVSTGNVIWNNTVGPLSTDQCSPVVDSNGWVSIGSLDGFLYSFSPTGVLKKFLKATALDSVVQVSPVLDCSGFAVFICQTMMEEKTSHIIGEYTYISATKPNNMLFTLLAPATGAVYWTGKYPGELSFMLSKSDLPHFQLDERILLALLASEMIKNPLPCYTASQKLSWICSQAEPKYVSIYTGNERAILLFLLFQFITILLLAISVRFCCIFWRKKKLQEHNLGKFLEKRRSLHKKKKALSNMISDLEQKAVEESVANELLEQMGEIVRAKEGIERKLSSTYSLGRDSTRSQPNPILPLYDGKSKSYSFGSTKKESVTIFNTLSETSTSGESGGESAGESTESGRSGNNSDSSGSGREEVENWHSCGDLGSVAKGKAPISVMEGKEGYYERPKASEEGLTILGNPLFAENSVEGRSLTQLEGEEGVVMEPMQNAVSSRRMLLKRRRTMSSTT